MTRCHICRFEIDPGESHSEHIVTRYESGVLVKYRATSHDKCLRRCEQQRDQAKDRSETK